MAAEKGSAFVLKVESATPGTYTTVGGMRSTTFTLNNEMVDTTDKDSAKWRELLTGAGFTTVTVSGSGIFKDTTSEGIVRTNAQNATVNNYQIVFEGGDTYEGGFLVTSLEYAGDHNGARTYSITLENSGAITFTAGA